jgi:hypothetical protein
MDGFLIRIGRILLPTRLVYCTREDENDNADKMVKPHTLSIRFEGLHGLQNLQGL